MHYVYLLRSMPCPEQRHIGFTEDLRQRLRTHNEGGSPHTAKYRPWELATYLAFSDKHKALAFDLYPKSGSGHAFANKRLW